MKTSAELPEHVHTVELAVADVYGVLRGKRVPASAWPAVLESGLHMASIIYSWTPRCEVRDVDEWLPPERGWPDMHVRPMVDTLRRVPWRPGSAMVLCDVTEEDGSELTVSPRRALHAVLEQAAAMGFVVNIGFEIEFCLLDAVTKLPRYEDVQCYGIARGAEYEPVLAPMRNQLAEFGIPIEASNTEYGPGQLEVNVRHGEAMATADNAVLFGNAVKEIAAQHGYLASFMAKIRSDEPGSGLHLHHSLWGDKSNAFADHGALSDVGRSYLGGLQRHMAEFSLLGSPTPNAFKRRQPYSFCPLSASWLGSRQPYDRTDVGLEKSAALSPTQKHRNALLSACDQTRWTGRRDHAMFVLTIQTGLRIAELAALTHQDITLSTGANVHTIGKGRKERRTPLTPPTRKVSSPVENWTTCSG